MLVAEEVAAPVAGLGEPYHDPGVALFGLRNAVWAVGDQFLEVVAPLAPGPGTAAGRHLARRGPGGYMLIFAVEDLAGARERAAALGVRTAWEIDLPDIAATHLHPADLGGTIVSVDAPVPPGSWRWAGPGWEERSVRGALLGARVEVPDPEAVAARWEAVLGTDPATLGVEFGQGDGGMVDIGLDVGGRRVSPLGAWEDVPAG